jgi:hypothetical protein
MLEKIFGKILIRIKGNKKTRAGTTRGYRKPAGDGERM